MRNSIKRLYTISFLFSIILYQTFSCKPSVGVQVSDGEKVNVKFSITGILEEPVSTIASVSGGIGTNNNTLNSKSTIEGKDFIIEGSIGNSDNNEHIKSKIKQAATYTPIPPGIRVRLLIYEIAADGSEIFKSNLGVPVQQDFFAITLEKNRNYKFYAYSYNSFTTYPPSPANENNPVIITANDNALIYAGGSIALLNDPVHVNVIFRHVTSRISVGVDAQSYFAYEITAININLNNVPLTTHNLDLRTGNLVGNVQTTINSNLSFDFASFENSPAKMLSQNRLYTSSTLSGYSYTINSLEVRKNGVNEVLIYNDNPRSITVSGFSRPLTTVYFSRNYIYPAVNIGNNSWAKGNLYYDLAPQLSADKRYRFAEPLTVKQTENCNYYFDWNSLIPRSESSSPAGDPCSLVYPVGKWKTPSEEDYQTLIANSTRSNEGAGAVKFTNISAAQPLVFHQAGWLFGLGCISATNDTDGQYWTSSQTSLGTLGRIFEIGNETGGPRTEFDSEAKSTGASVRCVRVK